MDQIIEVISPIIEKVSPIFPLFLIILIPLSIIPLSEFLATKLRTPYSEDSADDFDEPEEKWKVGKIMSLEITNKSKNDQEIKVAFLIDNGIVIDNYENIRNISIKGVPAHKNDEVVLYYSDRGYFDSNVPIIIEMNEETVKQFYKNKRINV